MHDIGSTQTEFIPEMDGHETNYEGDFETFEFDFENESSQEFGQANESPFSEAEEEALAAELLGVGSEQELDYFLGSLIKKVGSVVGKVVKSPIGKALGGGLKTLLKTAAPIAGGALGTFLGGPVGGMLGSKLGSFVGSKLEVGQEVSEYDFEVARSFVRAAGGAVNRALQAGDQCDPRSLASQVHSEVSGELENYLLKSGAQRGGSNRGRVSPRYRQRRGTRQFYGQAAPSGPVPPWAVPPYIIPAWACASVNSAAPMDGDAGPDGGGEMEMSPMSRGSSGGAPQHLRHRLPMSGKWYRKGKSIVIALG